MACSIEERPDVVVVSLPRMQERWQRVFWITLCAFWLTMIAWEFSRTGRNRFLAVLWLILSALNVVTSYRKEELVWDGQFLWRFFKVSKYIFKKQRFSFEKIADLHYIEAPPWFPKGLTFSYEGREKRVAAGLSKEEARHIIKIIRDRFPVLRPAHS